MGLRGRLIVWASSLWAASAVPWGAPGAPDVALDEWFEESCVSRGGGFVARGLERFPTGLRGTYAGRDLAPGEVLLRLPRACVYSQGDAREDIRRGGVDGFKVAEEDFDGYIELAMGMLVARWEGPEHKFHVAVRTLPDDVSHFPSRWPEEERKKLPARAKTYVEAGRANMEAVWRDFQRDYAPFTALFNFDHFERACLLARSRAFFTGDEVFWAPFFDRFNHAGKRSNVDWYPVAGFAKEGGNRAGFVEVRAVRAIAAGEELSFDYGPQNDQDRLLVQYGFTMACDPRSACEDEIHVDVVSGKLSVDLRMPRPTDLATARRLGVVAAARFFHYDAQDFVRHCAKVAASKLGTTPKRGDAAAARTVATVARRLLLEAVAAETDRWPPYADCLEGNKQRSRTTAGDAASLFLGYWDVANAWRDVFNAGVDVDFADSDWIDWINEDVDAERPQEKYLKEVHWEDDVKMKVVAAQYVEL